jgi:hypothetical protein
MERRTRGWFSFCQVRICRGLMTMSDGPRFSMWGNLLVILLGLPYPTGPGVMDLIER